MGRLFGWRWLWRSRIRLLAVGLLILAGGVAVLVMSILDLRSNTQAGRGLVGGVVFAGLGGWFVLQALLSDAGAFGDTDTSDY
jgi:hypothetical protein